MYTMLNGLRHEFHLLGLNISRIKIAKQGQSDGYEFNENQHNHGKPHIKPWALIQYKDDILPV